MTEQLNEIEKKIMSRLQDGLPLVERPFEEIANELTLPQDTVLANSKSLLDQGLMRRLSGFFDPRRLGYTSTLCGMKVPESQIEQTAGVINNFVEVTHNYLRDNRQYNLWFTIIAKGRAEIDRIQKKIEFETGYPVADFVATGFFKIQVRFALDGGAAPKPQYNLPNKVLPPVRRLISAERALVHAIGGNLPLVEQPFAALAADLNNKYQLPTNVNGNQVLELLQGLQEQGYMRRIGGVIKHTQVGYQANWMVVWQVADEQVQRVGKLFASDVAVSHCYCRQTKADWPWNLYTMIHGADENQARGIVLRLQQASGLADHLVLSTLAELKKTGMRYFPEMLK